MPGETLGLTPTSGQPAPTGLIDRIPTAEELSDMYSHPAYGQVSGLQREIDVVGESGYDRDKNRGMLIRLRDEIVFGGPNPELGRSIYDVSEYIAKSELAAVDPERGATVQSVLETARLHAQPNSYIHVDPERGTSGTHNRKRKELGLEQVSLVETAKQVREAAQNRGFEWHDPKDAYLLTFMQTGAHEAGHAVLAGISEAGYQIAPTGKNKSLQASYDYIRQHPEMSLTADLEHDTATQEERFAEGYGQFVADCAMQTLGYTAEEVEFMHGLMSFPEVTDIADGGLGYKNPLSSEELVDELTELKTMIDQKSLGHGVTNPHMWGETVQLVRDQKAQNAGGANFETQQPYDLSNDVTDKLNPVETLSPKKRDRIRALGRSMLSRITRR